MKAVLMFPLLGRYGRQSQPRHGHPGSVPPVVETPTQHLEDNGGSIPPQQLRSQTRTEHSSE